MIKSPSSMVGCFAFNASSNPSVFAMVKSPSLIVGCFVFNASSNLSVFAMVKSPSFISSCLSFISVKRLVVPTKKELALILSPVISPVVVKSPCCVISPKHLFLLVLYYLEQLEKKYSLHLDNLW